MSSPNSIVADVFPNPAPAMVKRLVSAKRTSPPSGSSPDLKDALASRSSTQLKRDGDGVIPPPAVRHS
jgi:hypothetical protein